jgi:hypothetical protein
MKRLLVLVVTVLGLLVLPAVPAGAAPEAACAVTWGSQAKSAGPDTSPFSELLDVRTGRHACYDRLVVDLDGRASGYVVRYVNVFRAEGSGQVIPLPGGAKIQIVVRAPANDVNGNPTYPAVVGRHLPGVSVAGYATFRSTRYGGSFEGLTTLGLGVRARLPFRVFKLGNRVVIDVAHHW